ncbi:hypothetical protein EO238_26020, partial [Citrobacter sp. AAK_AS5]
MTGGLALARRPVWRLRELLADWVPPTAWPEAASAADAADPAVTGLTLDSRHIQPGWLFLACHGGQGHGLQFAAAARARG